MRMPTGPVPRSRRRGPGASAVVLVWLFSMGVGVARVGAARAEAPRFLAEVDRNQIAVGDPFIYQVTLSVGNDQVSDYRPPDFKGLRVLSTPAAPNQSTQMQFGGAGMFVQISYSWQYQLAATHKGMITIGQARVRVGSQELRSNVLPLSVSNAGAPAGPPPIAALPSSPSPSPSSSQASGPAAGASSGPASSTPAAGNASGVPPEAADGGSFIRLVTDKQKVFLGEAISATWYLYMNQAADKYDTQVEPHTEGFWTEDVQIPSRRGGLVLTQETIEGRSYQVGTVLKKALFPLQVGRLTITPMEAQISRSDFFGNAVRSQSVRSIPTAIEISPLPKTGQPTGFDAANVGTFTLVARVDRSQVAVGEAVTLTIEISGHGNLRKLVLPTIPKLDGWKAYEPRVNVIVDPASGVSGTKTAEVLLLPERAGTVTLSALTFDTFDPDARRYAQARTAPITLTATGDAAVGTHGARGGAIPAVGGGFSENVITGEIRPLHARAELRRDLGTTFFRTRGFVGVLGLAPLGFALAVVAFRIRDRLTADTGSRRRRHARKKVRAHLLAADGHRQRGQAGAFFIEIDRVIREALTSRLGRPVKGLRMDELRSLLGARGLAAAESDRVIALLEECDHARFAPKVVGINQSNVDPVGGGPIRDVASLGTTLDLASDLIDFIEKAPLHGEAGA